MIIVTDDFVLTIINFEEIISDTLNNFRKSIIQKFKPNCERDVQDYFTIFYDIKGYNFLKEKESVLYFGKNFTPDFTYPILNVAVELKFVNDEEKIQKVREQLSADIAAYSTRWKDILIVVYDKGGNIRNVDRFTKDFHRDGDIRVRCIVIKE